MPAAVKRPRKKKIPVLSDFVPKAYPNQKVQGGMGVLMPTQFNGGYATGDHSPVLEEKQEYVVPNVYSGYDNLTQEEFIELAKNPNPDVVNENYDFSGVQAAIDEYNKKPEVVTQASYDEERYNETPIEASIALAESAFEDEPVLKNNQYEPINDMVAGENLFKYNVPTPVLTDNKTPKANPKAVLDTTSSNDRKGSAVSANARGSMMPFAKIDRNEALIRIGGAMVGGSSQGYTGAMKAATAEYGNIQDANRVSETNAFNKAEATRLAEERIAALKAKGSSKTTDKDKETFNNVSSQLNSFQSGLDAIAQSKAEGGNLTGVGGIFKSFIDNYTGSPDAARRLLLSRLKVDDALLRVAETKGAISNKEMDLFLQPAPKNFQDEKIWVDWINERMVALRNVQNRLNGNVVINESEQSYRYRAPTSNYKPVEVDGFTIQQK